MEKILEPVARYFWDCDPESLAWKHQRSFIIRRVIQEGNQDAYRWLRSLMGDEALRDWFMLQNGHGLDPRQLRYWGLILKIEDDLVDRWVEEAKQTNWEQRRR